MKVIGFFYLSVGRCVEFVLRSSGFAVFCFFLLLQMFFKLRSIMFLLIVTDYSPFLEIGALWNCLN